jgi:hypothetical protein
VGGPTAAAACAVFSPLSCLLPAAPRAASRPCLLATQPATHTHLPRSVNCCPCPPRARCRRAAQCSSRCSVCCPRPPLRQVPLVSSAHSLHTHTHAHTTTFARTHLQRLRQLLSLLSPGAVQARGVGAAVWPGPWRQWPSVRAAAGVAASRTSLAASSFGTSATARCCARTSPAALAAAVVAASRRTARRLRRRPRPRAGEAAPSSARTLHGECTCTRHAQTCGQARRTCVCASRSVRFWLGCALGGFPVTQPTPPPPPTTTSTTTRRRLPPCVVYSARPHPLLRSATPAADTCARTIVVPVALPSDLLRARRFVAGCRAVQGGRRRRVWDRGTPPWPLAGRGRLCCTTAWPPGQRQRGEHRLRWPRRLRRLLGGRRAVCGGPRRCCRGGWGDWRRHRPAADPAAWHMARRLGFILRPGVAHVRHTPAGVSRANLTHWQSCSVHVHAVNAAASHFMHSLYTLAHTRAPAVR